MRGKIMEEANKISPLDVHKHLPKTNCGECKTATCMGFAIKILSRSANLNECAYLKQAKHIQNNIILKELLAPILNAKETKLVIHKKLCNGCGNCVINCPPNLACSIEASGGKGPTTQDVVLKMTDGIVIDNNLHSCRRFEEDESDAESEACRLCIDACPLRAIEFI